MMQEFWLRVRSPELGQPPRRPNAVGKHAHPGSDRLGMSSGQGDPVGPVEK
jgi:hypothetical protein